MHVNKNVAQSIPKVFLKLFVLVRNENPWNSIQHTKKSTVFDQGKSKVKLDNCLLESATDLQNKTASNSDFADLAHVDESRHWFFYKLASHFLVGYE